MGARRLAPGHLGALATPEKMKNFYLLLYVHRAYFANIPVYNNKKVFFWDQELWITYFFTKISSGTFGKLFIFIYMKITRQQLRRLIKEAGLDTTWNTGGRVISIQDVIGYLDRHNRRVYTVSARKLKSALGRELKVKPDRVQRADISYPLIAVFDRDTGMPTVILDGNHRLAKAVMLDAPVGIRILFSDEYDAIFE